MFAPSPFSEDRKVIDQDHIDTVVFGICNMPAHERALALNIMLAGAEFKPELTRNIAAYLLVLMSEGADGFTEFVKAEAVAYGLPV